MSLWPALLSGVISWLVVAFSGLALLAGAAALAWSRLPLAQYRTLAAIAGGVLLFAAGWGMCLSDGREKADAARFAAEKRALETTLQAEQRKSASLAEDARQAQAQAAQAEEQARADAEAVAKTPDTPALDAETSARVRGMWR